jgi:23S rRNA (cytosine1962-C5)-methyltransferase
MSYSNIILHKGKETSPLRFHPWIFSGAIAKKENDLKEGEIVEVYSSQKQYLGTGYYANGSIAIRLISFEKKNIDANFWTEKSRRLTITGNNSASLMRIQMCTVFFLVKVTALRD